MKKKNIKNKIKGQGEVNMSLYEINQGIIGQLPKYDGDQIKNLEERIDKWDLENFINKKYFMLLCRDINYYTLLHFDEEKSEFRTLGEGVAYLFSEANYTIHSDEILDDHCEIWAKNEEGTYAFMLFPYDEGVVYYG